MKSFSEWLEGDIVVDNSGEAWMVSELNSCGVVGCCHIITRCKTGRSKCIGSDYGYKHSGHIGEGLNCFKCGNRNGCHRINALCIVCRS